MSESIIANSIRYGGSECGQLKAVMPYEYTPTEAEIKAANERQVKQAKKERAFAVIAFAEKLTATLNLSVSDAFDRAEEFKEFADKYFESKL